MLNYLYREKEFSMLEKDGRIFHLVLLAENNKGYQNLLKISSESYIKGFYYKPRIDKELFKKSQRRYNSTFSMYAGRDSKKNTG